MGQGGPSDVPCRSMAQGSRMRPRHRTRGRSRTTRRSGKSAKLVGCIMRQTIGYWRSRPSRPAHHHRTDPHGADGGLQDSDALSSQRARRQKDQAETAGLGRRMAELLAFHKRFLGKPATCPRGLHVGRYEQRAKADRREGRASQCRARCGGQSLGTWHACVKLGPESLESSSLHLDILRKRIHSFTYLLCSSPTRSWKCRSAPIRP